MKKKISLGLIFALVILAVYFSLQPTRISDDINLNQDETSVKADINIAPGTDSEINMQDAAAADEQRRQQFESKYAEIEQARKTLKSNLGSLKTRLWGLELPPEQARSISKEMSTGYAMLKNPPLLGAFSAITDMEKELNKIKAVNMELDKIKEYVATFKKAQQNN